MEFNLERGLPRVDSHEHGICRAERWIYGANGLIRTILIIVISAVQQRNSRYKIAG
jgi:hypothetical protein